MARNRSSHKPSSSRRSFLQTTLLGGVAATLPPLCPALGAAREISTAAATPAADIKPFELDELTISALQDGLNSGQFTARSLVEKYTARIDEIDKHGPALNSVIELNPDALLDRRFARPGAQSQRPTRTTARYSRAHQRQHRYRG